VDLLRQLARASAAVRIETNGRLGTYLEDYQVQQVITESGMTWEQEGPPNRNEQVTFRM
jgi:hypothetical protein